MKLSDIKPPDWKTIGKFITGFREMIRGNPVGKSEKRRMTPGEIGICLCVLTLLGLFLTSRGIWAGLFQKEIDHFKAGHVVAILDVVIVLTVLFSASFCCLLQVVPNQEYSIPKKFFYIICSVMLVLMVFFISADRIPDLK